MLLTQGGGERDIVIRKTDMPLTLIDTPSRGIADTVETLFGRQPSIAVLVEANIIDYGIIEPISGIKNPLN
jgi:hypothetical protein